MSTTPSQWADLPKELLEMIGKRLDSRIDVYRFRAVCSSWRSSVPLSLKQSSPPLLFKVPPPIKADAFLSRATVCCLHLPHKASASSSSVTTASQSWLTKVEESTRGDLELLIPLSNRQITAGTTPPKRLNMLNFNLVELTKAYSLKLARGCCVFGINKVVLLPNRETNHALHLLVIYHEGKLAHWRTGDENWTRLGELSSQYDDMIVYKGQVYVVDRLGTISWIDSSLKLVQYSPPLFGCGTQKYLVESCGDLYVVDKYLDGRRRRWEGEGEGEDNNNMNIEMNFLFRNYPICRSKTVEMKIYRLDEEWGTWVDVRSLGDRVYVLGNECCFSVSKQEFIGCEGNCVYFIDPADVGCHGELSGYDARAFNLEDGKIGKVAFLPHCFHIFWPPPSKLMSNPRFFQQY